MKVWILEYLPPYEPGHIIGVYATQELVEAAKIREDMEYEDPENLSWHVQDVIDSL